MEVYILHLFLLFIVAQVCSERDFRIVSLKQGSVKGYKDILEPVYIFYNVPYATAPIGKDRFKGPLTPPTWSDTLEALDKRILCPQGKVNGKYIGTNKVFSDNCLIANIYAPASKEVNLPVVIYIHGGAYQYGYGEMVQPKKQVKTDNVIAVNFNYRLGVHGFLCLGTELAPGNAGMKDQVALLRWVKENIASFGGNPNDITLCGFSAGTASVELLLMSKLSKDLFNKAILESGSSLALWAMQVNPSKNAKDGARSINFTNFEDISALEQFYVNSKQDLLNSEIVLRSDDSSYRFSPCLENENSETETFINDPPIVLLENGNYSKVPMLYGFANEEGLLRLSLFDEWKDKMNDNFADYIPENLKFDSYEQKVKVAKQIKVFYFGDDDINDKNVDGFINYYSDIISVYSTLKAIELHHKAGHENIYLYEYSYVPIIQLPSPMGVAPVIKISNVKGASHCYETFIVHEMDFSKHLEFLRSMEYRNMRSIMKELWSSFIRSGKPSSSKAPEWTAVGADWSPHMSLTMPPLLKGSLLKDRVMFLDSIYQKHFLSPVPPPRSKD